MFAPPHPLPGRLPSGRRHQCALTLDKAPQLRLFLRRGKQTQGFSKHSNTHDPYPTWHIRPRGYAKQGCSACLVIPASQTRAAVWWYSSTALGSHRKYMRLAVLGLRYMKYEQRFPAGVGQPFIDGSARFPTTWKSCARPDQGNSS